MICFLKNKSIIETLENGYKLLFELVRKHKLFLV